MSRLGGNKSYLPQHQENGGWQPNERDEAKRLMALQRLQRKYDKDAEVQAEKQKVKDEKKRRERLAQIEAMGIDWGHSLGGESPNSMGREFGALQNQEQKRLRGIEGLQQHYDEGAAAKLEKQKEMEEQKRNTRLSELEELPQDSGQILGEASNTLENETTLLSQEQKRLHVIQRLQKKYDESKAEKERDQMNQTN